MGLICQNDPQMDFLQKVSKNTPKISIGQKSEKIGKNPKKSEKIGPNRQKMQFFRDFYPKTQKF